MNWIRNVVPPRIKNMFSRRPVPQNLWIKCPVSGRLVSRLDVEQNDFVIPVSNYHLTLPIERRLALTFDDGKWEEMPPPAVPYDPLKFRDRKRYVDRLQENRIATGSHEAIRVGIGPLDGILSVIAVQDYNFMVGSLGMAAGEAIIDGLSTATERGLPFILFASAGGARLQEGIFSLMQMPRTTIAVQRHRSAKLPYIVVLTDPTLGGVTASYAMLGDIHLAEPGAVIGFAGRRVIEQTIREALPPDAQRSEFLRDRGMIDIVVHRHEIKSTLSRLLNILTKTQVPLVA